MTWGSSWEHVEVKPPVKRNQIYKPTHFIGRQQDAKTYLFYTCCQCSNVFDPNTTSFAALNNEASKTNWTVQLYDEGYFATCEECK